MIRPANCYRAADAANRVLVRLGIDRLPVRPLDILRRCRNTRVYTFDQAAEALDVTQDELERLCSGADALTIRGDGGMYLVCYRAGGNPARLNFTLAHELGHIVLCHTGKSAAEEAEADCFASHLLCPDAVIEMMEYPAAEHLAQLCYISRAAAERALRRKKCCVQRDVYLQMRGYIDAYVGNGARHPLAGANEKG